MKITEFLRNKPLRDEDELTQLFAKVPEGDPAWEAIGELLGRLLVTNFEVATALTVDGRAAEAGLRLAQAARWLEQEIERQREKARAWRAVRGE